MVVLLNVAGWGVLLAVVVPREFQLGDAGAFGIAVGVTAFLLGATNGRSSDQPASSSTTSQSLPCRCSWHFSIGAIVLVQLMAEELSVPALDWVASVDLQSVGSALVAVFVLIWAGSVGALHLLERRRGNVVR